MDSKTNLASKKRRGKKRDYINTFTFRSPDFYHTCYCLSGLSLAQHQIADPEFILGGSGNLLKAIDPKFNLIRGKAEKMISYFERRGL